MNAFVLTYQVERQRPSGIIVPMPELDEMITVTEAFELANGRYTRGHITQVVREGHIPGVVRRGIMWFIPRAAFLEWLGEERRPGPKTDN